MAGLVILAISAIVHFIRFGQPAAVVFDEVHAGTFMSAYWHGTYFFDVHPPLGKLIEVFFGYLTGANHAIVDFTTIGNALPPSVVILRLVPMLAGFILPLIVYAILRRLEFSKLAAFTAAMLLTLENSLIVQSRFILFDIPMLAFGFLGILCYLEWRRRAPGPIRMRPFFLISSLICIAAAPSIKWTGLAFFLIVIVMEAHRLFSANSNGRRVIVALSGTISVYGAAILALYMALFAVHFSLLPKAGTGDAFMSPQFNKTLSGTAESNNPSLQSEGFIGKFVELNVAMYRADNSLTAPHEYSSKWYTWPLELRPIFYWQSAYSTSTPRSYIYLLGNPLTYLLGTISVVMLLLYGILIMVRRDLREQVSPARRRALIFVLAGFLANFVPFIFIGRVMFLYHYEAALVFAITAITFIIDLFRADHKKIVSVVLIGLALAAFTYFAPLTYGTPLTDRALQARMWLPSWR